MKFTKSYLLAICILGTFSLAFSASAQELTLFEEIVEAPTPQPRQIRQRALSNQTNFDPAFTLKSTSRFGDTYTASLISREGANVNVKWQNGQTIPIAGFDGYNVIEMNSRTALIRLPSGEDCVAAAELGVSCTEGGSVAILQLSLATALSVPQTDIQPVATIPAAQRPNPGPRGTLGNTRSFSPEQLQAIVDRQQRRAERLNELDEMSIDNDEVPEGMTVIRTPFGDRLAPRLDL